MKFCNQCGSQCLDTASFCEKCGMRFHSPTLGYPPPQNPIYGSPLGKDYTKIGGWLLFFVIITILAIISNIRTIVSEIHISATTLSVADYLGEGVKTALTVNIFGQIITVAGVAFQILFIVQVFSRKATFLKSEQIGRIILFISYFFTLFIPISLIRAENFETSEMSGFASTVIGLIAGFFLFPLYYCKSIRVRTYMGSDEYMEKAIFAYKNQPPLARRNVPYENGYYHVPPPTQNQTYNQPYQQPFLQSKTYIETFCPSCGHKYNPSETNCPQCYTERN